MRRIHALLRSVRARLTLWYTGALAVTLAAVAAAALLFFFPSPDPRDVRYLTTDHNVLVRDFARAASGTMDVRTIAAVVVHDMPDSTMLVAIFDSAGHPVADNAPSGASVRAMIRKTSLATLAESLQANHPLHADPFKLRARGGGFLVRTSRVQTPAGPYTAATLLPLHSTQETLELVHGVLAVALPVVLILAGLGGYFLAGRALAPMRLVTEQTARIGPDNLHERLPVPTETEVAALATVVNGLLERVDASFAQQRRFMADASHELRTPVAVLGIEAEVTLGKAQRSEAEYREALQVIRDAGARLGRIVDDLFLLSRADAGEPMVVPRDTFLEDVVCDASRAVRRLADQRAIAVEVAASERAPFVGDPALLGRLLLNLLQNAVSYSGIGASVTIALGGTKEHYRVTVSDSGPGIAPEDQPHLFERFYRADKVRSRASDTAGGAGLGLSIARWIAEAHGGTLTLASSSPAGTVFELRLPRASGRVT